MIAPLDWGLGHAVRDIPLINDLISNNYEVIIASSGSSGNLLKQEFPNLKHYLLPSINIKYSDGNRFFIKLIFQIPKFIRNIRIENIALNKILQKEEIDLIISDNRYGVYSLEIPNIFITHQLFPILPKGLRFFEGFISKFQRRFIDKFDICFIPDYKGSINLSGKLSHKYSLNKKFKFIGPLSEFQNKDNIDRNKIYELLVILSGPEPQRTFFENILLKQIKESGKKALIISGKPKNKKEEIVSNIKIINHLSRNELLKAVRSSNVIISRAGYTTIMDLISLKKKAILTATPGQTEQEYLSEYLNNRTYFVFCKQNEFNLNEAMIKLNDLKPDFSIFDDCETDSYMEIIEELLFLNS